MASETYHKTGRGGAGNYYSPRDIEEATKRSAEVAISIPISIFIFITIPTPPCLGTKPSLTPCKDLEAQPLPPSSTTTTTTSTSALQDYAHSGRGGAGNFYSPSTLQSTGTFASSGTIPTTSNINTNTKTSTPSDDSTAPPSAVKESGPSETVYTGRGGAGNFRVGQDVERRKREDEERELRERRERVSET
ncbi:MAG: hypothetical protein M1830_005119, partial [Pleopsidium flavum]